MVLSEGKSWDVCVTFQNLGLVKHFKYQTLRVFDKVFRNRISFITNLSDTRILCIVTSVIPGVGIHCRSAI